MRVAAEEIHRVLGPRRTSIWLTTGSEEPSLAIAVGGPRSADGVPELVRFATRRPRTATAQDGGGGLDLAVPIHAPQSGLIGVVHVEGIARDVAGRSLVEELATEAGFALETANLYEQAIADREKSDAVLGRVGDAVVITDARGTIREWNAAAERVFGRPGAEAVGTTCAALLGLHVGERTLDCRVGCALLGTAGEHDAILGQEVWRRRDDGRKQPLLGSVSAVGDAEGNPFEIIHSFRDITKLKEADEAKTLFLATASHELRTPLTVIRGFAQLLAASRYANEEERDQALEAIERRAIQLNRIVERLLLSSRIEAGRADLLRGEVDLAPIVHEHVAGLVAVTGRAITVPPHGSLPVVLADPDAVATIMDHLLDNAIKYSPGGEPIDVSFDHDPTTVTIRVQDAGIGMDAEQAARCFEKFWQAESTDVRRFGGTGIGLFIVRSLTEAMDGRVSAHSEPGRGARFEVALPRADVPASTEEDETTSRGVGEPSVIREFMRQLGIPDRRQG